MKSTIFLCAIAAICFFEIGDAAYNINNAGTLAITRLKSTARSTTNDLTRYKSRFSSDLKRKLGNLKLDQMSNVNQIVNPALGDVRIIISTANARGINAERCYEPARLRLKAASDETYKQLDECYNTGLSSVEPVEKNIDATIALGNRIVNDLDAIAINCYSPNSVVMQNCIIGKIPGASASVKTLQNTADELKRSGDSASSNAITTAFKCNLDAPQNLRNEATSVRNDTRDCVKAS